MGKHHGGKGTRLYAIWKAMKTRCCNSNFKAYARYGGRGITVCDEWLHDFAAFRDWALANGYRDDLTLDRKETDGPYAPWNCRWATYKEQANNTRRNKIVCINGEHLTIAAACERFGVNPHLVYDRITRLGWSDEKAIFTPARKIKNGKGEDKT